MRTSVLRPTHPTTHVILRHEDQCPQLEGAIDDHAHPEDEQNGRGTDTQLAFMMQQQGCHQLEEVEGGER